MTKFEFIIPSWVSNSDPYPYYVWVKIEYPQVLWYIIFSLAISWIFLIFSTPTYHVAAHIPLYPTKIILNHHVDFWCSNPISICQSSFYEFGGIRHVQTPPYLFCLWIEAKAQRHGLRAEQPAAAAAKLAAAAVAAERSAGREGSAPGSGRCCQTWHEFG